ncbi:UbiD family decarboxylase [Compostimonas suwonensis]|uniref:4-hydroxy-3-polyprenylbenzoate decarboxylase/2,5-furandicarboxylate decarboxylase 1 n=1 Tax=Compostimonas suwonensis TaxID=1048394 RepID=A0A2M9BZS7_9MICO|nr:UbiD family decarboxylase [Compostimonas suwonensis]PJJ63601.1 4-hydroxy-3-polyprenylbenzoate decarboxylase/2,5-furandicarboxylate decarboxylase 1 [Compostimonas suwonensis]
MRTTAWHDLRQFLDALELRGDLLRISDPVDWEYQAVGLTRQSSDIEGPALLFENMRDSSFSCLSGLFGASRRVALALGQDYDYLLRHFGELESKLIEPELTTSPAPCQEIVLTGEDIDILSLPLLRHFELDGGRYLTAGLQVAHDPDTGVGNVSIHRQLPLDRNHLTVFAPLGRHLRTIIERWHERGERAEIAVVIGADPVTQIASQARAPYGVDEFAIAGGMRGEALEMVRCTTIDVRVPATAEIVIEGFIVPGRLEDDGPFGEYPGTYSEAKPAPVMEITAITHRRGAIYQNTLTGTPMTENHWMMQPSATALAYREALRITPEIRSVHITPGGASRHHVIVSLKKRHPAEPRNVMLGLMASTLGAKLVVVVDDDIDPYDLQQVEWAVNTRMQPDRDVVVVPGLYSPTLDPSAPAARTSAKMGIDATAPLGHERRMYEPPRIIGDDGWSLRALLDDSDWSVSHGAAYLDGPRA